MFELHDTSKEFLKSAWLRYVSEEDNYYKLPALDAQDQSLNLRKSPARSVGDEVIANVLTGAAVSHKDDVPGEDDD